MPTDGRSKLTGTHPHGVEDLCDAGLALYARALREGHVPTEEADPVPCLIDCGLLQPDLQDMRWLRPVAPAVALPRLLRATAEDIARQRQREARLAEAFEPLMALDAGQASATDTPANTVLSSIDQINTAIARAMAASSHEVLTIQPGGKRPVALLAAALLLEQEMLSRGCRMRTLYQHTSRHDPAVLAHYERLEGDVEVRTLDEVTDRLIVVDRSVAFMPANTERTVAVEVRHPAVVAYLATTFDRLWRLATPMYPEAAPQPTLNGITPRQHAIAGLLIEGLTDAAIAERLGMNIRTARVHIAKLAATLGSESRAQLGYLIAESGILKQEEGEAE
ncbi:helix-turn-helix transcriptional regulator [Streptomyces sp. NBC_01236]|uniref:helix-turn-helix transcriptional regulator n=1 Tax=Streptomyces sp. NBC_01236 TaxID=2903789 RepID=UPI002E162A70|nr:helix-turn-helix transcriptional regulator [Streptomyces sp. NBC_01236]